MLDLTTLPPVVEAVLDAGALIGVVLLEAIVLYVGYGAVEEAFGQSVLQLLTNE